MAPAAHAEFEVTSPDGRRIVLYDNGTWRYTAGQPADVTPDPKDEGVQAVLTLEKKTEHGPNCRFSVRLVNNFTYEIKTIVPFYAAYRHDGVIYDTVSAASGFTSIKPGDQQVREFEFVGITCDKISRVQVLGGDRCDMGDLTKFADKGRCLARIQVVESKIIRFDK